MGAHFTAGGRAAAGEYQPRHHRILALRPATKVRTGRSAPGMLLLTFQ